MALLVAPVLVMALQQGATHGHRCDGIRGIGLGGNLGARLIGSNVGGAYMSNTLTPELLKRLMMQTGGLLGGTATRPYPN